MFYQLKLISDLRGFVEFFFCISQMHFRSPHMFREENHVADVLTNCGTSSIGFVCGQI